MWVDKYRPKKFSDLLGEEVSGILALGTVAVSRTMNKTDEDSGYIVKSCCG